MRDVSVQAAVTPFTDSQDTRATSKPKHDNQSWRRLAPRRIATGGCRQSDPSRERKTLAPTAGITKRIRRDSLPTASLPWPSTPRAVAARAEAISHADPGTTMRYYRARQSVDRPATYIVAAFVVAAP